MTAAQPGSRTARQTCIADLLAQHRVSSQVQLVESFINEGIEITQAMLSGDLDELGARKIRDGANGSRYSIVEDALVAPSGTVARMQRVLDELLVSIDHSGTIVVVRAPPEAAQYLAGTIDRTGLREIAGTIVGDDTVMCLIREPLFGADLVQRLTAGTNQQTIPRDALKHRLEERLPCD